MSLIVRLGPVAAIAPGLLYLGYKCVNNVDNRLYWEYGGRMLGRKFTPGLIEWVHHGTGTLLGMDSAVVGSRVLAPYTDFTAEYPPGAMLYFAAIRFFFDNLETFSVAHALFSSFALIASIFALGRALASPTITRKSWIIGALILSFWILLTGMFVVNRFDTLVVAIVALGIALSVRRCLSWSTVMLGLGGSLKLWPLLLVPSIAAAYFPDRIVGRVMVLTRCGIIALLSFLIPHLVCVWIGTRPTDAFGYLAFFGQRPFQIESVAGNFVGILQLLNVVVASPGTNFGSDNIVFDYPYILLALWQGLAVTIIGFVCGLSLVGGGNKAFDVTSAMFVILTVVISSKVFSGEYLIWLLPVGFILVMYRDWVSVVLWLGAVSTLRIVYIFWASAIHLGAAGTIAIGCKNAFIIGLWVHAGRQLWRGQAVCVPWHPRTAQRGT